MTLKHLSLLGLLLVAAVPMRAAGTGSEPASFVDPFIGTSPNPYTKIGYTFDTGNVFPGAVCPRGMVAWSPDTTHKDKVAGGYWYPDKYIEDFSLTHFSGRGVPCLKDIGFVPLVQPVTVSPGTASTLPGKSIPVPPEGPYSLGFSHSNETASPGYYRVKLDNGIVTELTATPRTGLANFTFPAEAQATLLIRASGGIAVNGNEVSGHSRKVFFFAQFSAPIKSAQTWDGDKISDAPTATDGVILTFDTAKNPLVQVRVGISYTSEANAEANLKAENTGWDFEALREHAAALWNKELSRITVEGGTDDQKKVFYTALYHCFMHPNILENANGQYLGIDDQVHTVDPGHHQYQNIPAWDQYRSYAALMAVLASKESSDIMRSLVNYAQHDAAAHPNGGGMPRWEQMNINSGGMVGDGDDVIVANAYAYGARDFDVNAAWAAMDKGASQPGVTSGGHPVRSDLDKYTTLGYVPGSAAITLEYANDDFALSQLAQSLGNTQKAATYLARAENWKNLFDPAVGYIHPKEADGTWMANFSPKSGKGFVEGTASQYLWLVNFDLHGLIDKLGGNDKAIARLDTVFTKTNGGLSSEFAYMGNEPDEEIPWVYDFAGAPARTQAVVRRIQTELFTPLPSGLPGNDDAGAISSWYVFSALGLYPEIPGVAGFVVGSPVFPKATIHLDSGKTIEIVGEHAAPNAPYVVSLKVNGQTYDRPWIPWSLLANGAVLDFVLSDKPSDWGTDLSKAPPSFDGTTP
jgi:predicted alpha-1,2-mannosidase